MDILINNRMDKLEGLTQPYNTEQTLELLSGLEQMSNDLIGGFDDSLTKVLNMRFEGKDTQLKIKQNFHTLLALADRHFMEHVSKLDPDRYQLSLRGQATKLPHRSSKISIRGRRMP